MTDDEEWSRLDRPIRSKHADHLDRGPFVESLVRALVRDVKDREGHLIGRKSTGYVVGLTGKWGLGKSSVMCLAEERLRNMPHVMVATFNPWLFQGRDELLRGFFNALRDSTRLSLAEHAWEIAEFLNKYWKAIEIAGHAVAAVADAHGAGGTATGSWNHIKKAKPPEPKPRSPQEEREALERKLLSSNAAMIVLIDELDRVEDEDVRAVAQLIKAVGDIQGISYLVAYDPKRVADALGRGSGDDRIQSGERYLEKIIQHSIPLRPLFESDIDRLFDAALGAHKLKVADPKANHETAIIRALKSDVKTPRDVKRMIGAFAVIEAAVRGEVCPYDTLAYCWILTKSPALIEAIATHWQDLVDDPPDGGSMRRLAARLENETISITAVLGELGTQHEELLKLLFSQFGNRTGHSEDIGTRITLRRNLTRLLYLGNPPDMISRSEVERLWGLTNPADLDHELKVLYDRGRLPSLVDRLDDLLPSLNDKNDQTFWLALHRFVTGQKDWIQEADNRRSIASDAGTALLRLAIRDTSAAYRVKNVFEALTAARDLVIAPWILRKHMFLFGLTKHRGPESGHLAFSLEETRRYLELELPRYRAAILDGTALRRLPNLEALYVIGNVSLWDDELRTSLTNQLSSAEAIATFACQCVPPGYSTDRAHLNELFDADVVSDRINALGPTTSWASDAWVVGCVDRLRSILDTGEP